MTDTVPAVTTGTDEPLTVFPVKRRCPFGPPPEYAEIRADTPIARAELVTGRSVWMVTRMEDALAVLKSSATSNDRTDPQFPQTRRQPPIAPPAEKNLSYYDGDEHVRYRRIVSPEFTAKRAQGMRSAVGEIVERAIADMVAAGSPADFVEHVSLVVPSRVICELLGVPYGDHAFFQEASAKLVSRAVPLDEWKAAMASLHDYLTDLVASKASDPTADDLISRLHGRVRDGDLRQSQLATFAFHVLVAGHETTANMISLGILTFLQRPDLAERVRREPQIMPRVVEEFLRYHAILDDVPARLLTEDLTLGGVEMKAGDGVAVSAVAANFDDGWFDDPLEIDVDRENLKHIAFGAGKHQCLGASLARVELEVVYETVLRSLPGLRLATPLEELPFKYDDFSYGVHRMPVSW